MEQSSISTGRGLRRCGIAKRWFICIKNGVALWLRYEVQGGKPGADTTAAYRAPGEKKKRGAISSGPS